MREVFSSSLTHWGSPTQRHAEPGELCPHVYLYPGVGWLTHAQLYKLTLIYNTQIQTGRSLWGATLLCQFWCHHYALDVIGQFWREALCLYRKCTWGRRPSAQWTGFTSTAHTSPEWRPLTPVEWASTARHWSCRRLRVRKAPPPPTTVWIEGENTHFKLNSSTCLISNAPVVMSTKLKSRKSQDSSLWNLQDLALWQNWTHHHDHKWASNICHGPSESSLRAC